MGIDDMVNKGKEVFADAKDKVSDALHPDNVEKHSDTALDGASDFAKSVLPDEHDAKIDEVRGHVDGAIGNEPK